MFSRFALIFVLFCRCFSNILVYTGKLWIYLLLSSFHFLFFPLNFTTNFLMIITSSDSIITFTNIDTKNTMTVSVLVKREPILITQMYLCFAIVRYLCLPQQTKSRSFFDAKITLTRNSFSNLMSFSVSEHVRTFSSILDTVHIYMLAKHTYHLLLSIAANF